MGLRSFARLAEVFQRLFVAFVRGGAAENSRVTACSSLPPAALLPEAFEHTSHAIADRVEVVPACSERHQPVRFRRKTANRSPSITKSVLTPTRAISLPISGYAASVTLKLVSGSSM